MSADGVQIYFGSYLSTHEVQQDYNPLIVRRTVEAPDMIGECAGHDLNFGAFFEWHLSAGHYQTAIVFFVLKRSNDPLGYRHRSSLIADQMRDAYRRVYRAPPLIGATHRDEKICRKERPRLPTDPARMTDPPQIARQVNIEPLALEMEQRFLLAVRMRLGDEPAERSCIAPS